MDHADFILLYVALKKIPLVWDGLIVRNFY